MRKNFHNRIAKAIQRRIYLLRCVLAELGLFRNPSWQLVSTSFIVSTGRTGTKSLAKFIDQFENMLAIHEPYPYFRELGISFAIGKMGHKLAKKELIRGRRDVLRLCQLEGCNRYVESNNYLSPLLPVLLDAFPDSHVVHIVRDGRDVVTSGMSRKWYREDDPYPRIRALDFPADPYGQKWITMSRFEKNCWYWVKLNEMISNTMPDTAESILVKFEDMVDPSKEHDEISRILNFLGIDFSDHVTFSLPKANATSWRGYPEYASWDASKKETFWEICGWTMKKYGYARE